MDMSTINSDYMDNKLEKFGLIAERLKRKLALQTDKDLAEKLGLKPTAFNARKKSGSIPYSEIMDLADYYKLDLNWVFNGEAYQEVNALEENISPQTMSNKENVIVIKHQDLVSRFKDPEKGIENNVHLLTIEDASEQLYKKVSEYLKTTSEAAKIIKSEMESQKKGTASPKQYSKKQANGD